MVLIKWSYDDFAMCPVFRWAVQHSSGLVVVPEHVQSGLFLHSWVHRLPSVRRRDIFGHGCGVMLYVSTRFVVKLARSLPE